MSLDSRLHFYIQSLPKEAKEEVIRSINKKTLRGSAAKNAKIILEYFKEHGYRQPLIQDYSVDHIKEFISETLFGEYFPERIPQQDDEEELKQLELIRDAKGCFTLTCNFYEQAIVFVDI